MATAGRKPKPPQLRLLTGRGPGTDSGGRKVKQPPGFVRTAPKPPSWLSGEAAAEWRRIVPELERLKLLKGASRSSLSAYCETWAKFVVVTQAVQRHPTIPRVTTKRDGSVVEEQVANPLWGQFAQLNSALLRWTPEFGMTPSSEGRVSVSDGPASSEDLD